MINTTNKIIDTTINATPKDVVSPLAFFKSNISGIQAQKNVINETMIL